jgi:hypothetical protein
VRLGSESGPLNLARPLFVICGRRATPMSDDTAKVTATLPNDVVGITLLIWHNPVNALLTGMFTPFFGFTGAVIGFF